MKKYLITILVVLSMSIMLVGTAAAAPQAAGTSTLVEVQYVPGKGPVFTFSVNGKFSKSELKGTLHAESGEDYDLHCTQVDKDTVKCSVSGKVSGVNVSLTWGGSTFWAHVPEASDFCYNVYDYNPDFVWQSYGRHCQETEAEYGDQIPRYNPDFDDYYDAIFLPVGPVCSGIFEDAYYYPFCPF